MAQRNICVIGLGYVGLPLAVELANNYNVLGFDINNSRVEELKSGVDKTLEVSQEKLKSSKISLSSNEVDLKNSNVYIVTVPTPIDSSKQPDLSPLVSVSNMLAKYLKKNDLVIYESTVYPGCTEEVCVPILEKSGLKFQVDFECGYSPERMNPGDKEKTVRDIVKVVSASSNNSLDVVTEIYSSVVDAGIHKASSIKVAEAAKVIENSQRDINIAFVNELSIIFNRLDIDTKEVLDAAGTKWNFLKFFPGLVGGHCIGVDPYYLTHKAEMIGYHPEVILSGRRINDRMGKYVATEVVKKMIKKGNKVQGGKVLILGVTFKENCPDFRNTKVTDIYSELLEFGCKVDIYDPNVDPEEFQKEYNIELSTEMKMENYEAVIFAVSHKQFMEINLAPKESRRYIVYDVKGIFDKDLVDGCL